MSVANKLARVFLVEDSYGDIVLTKAIFKAKKVKLNLSIFRDGTEVIDFLKDCPDGEKPDLILLDFNLPKVDGVGVMKFMNTESLGHVPVFIISGSQSIQDMNIMVELGAKSFLKKPLDLPQLTNAIKPLPSVILTPHEDEWHLLRA